MTRRFEAVFFDVGDTLLRVGDPIVGFARALALAGIEVKRAHLERALFEARRPFLLSQHVGPPPDYAIDADLARLRRERLVVSLLAGLGLRGAEAERVGTALREAFVGPSFFEPFPDAASTLKRLRAAGYRLGIISNWDPRLEQLCASQGLARHFEVIVASEAVGYAKPGPRIFRRALEAVGLTPERAVHVGDNPLADVEGARAVGMAAVLLDRDGRADGAYAPTISTLSELPELLRRDDGR